MKNLPQRIAHLERCFALEAQPAQPAKEKTNIFGQVFTQEENEAMDQLVKALTS